MATGTCVVQGCAEGGEEREWPGRYGLNRAVLCDGHEQLLARGARFQVVRAVYELADVANLTELVLLSETGQPPVEADHGHAGRL